MEQRWKAVPATVLLLAVGFITLIEVPSPSRADALTIADARLPVPRADIAAVWTSQYAFLFGGHEISSASSGRTSDEILRYDPATDSLQAMGARLPTGRRSTSAVWTGSVAFLFGGERDESTTNIDEILRYDPVADRLDVMAARLPSGRADTAAFWDGRYAYIIGGWRFPDLHLFSDILRYDPTTDTLSTMASRLPTGRVDVSAVWTGQESYLFAGWDGANSAVDISRFDPAADSLTPMGASFARSRWGMGAVWSGEAAYLFGGVQSAQTGDELDEVVRYDPRSDTLARMPSRLPTPREDTAEVWMGREALLFGGRDDIPSRTRFDDIARYSPWLPPPPRRVSALPGPEAGEVRVTWGDLPHEDDDPVTHFRVYRNRAGEPPTQVAEVPATARAFSDRGLGPLQPYRYRVSSVNARGEGLPSPASCTAPSPGQFLPSMEPPCPVPEGWRERRIRSESTSVILPGDSAGAIVVDGRPSPEDSRLYEVTLAAGGQRATVVVFTGGLVQAPIHEESPAPPVRELAVHLSVSQRWDPTRPVCAVGVGTGGATSCLARLPVDPTDAAWLTTAGPKAETIVRWRVGVDREAADLFVRVPFAGQAAATP